MGELETAELRQDLETVLLELLTAASPSPPGDVRAAAEVVIRYCQRVGLPCRVEDPAPDRRNLIIEVQQSPTGRHLVWNGHLDTFPATGPDFAARSDGDRIYGRGAVDMKGGVAAFLVAARRIRRHPIQAGSLTLTLVCDEETFGPWGTRHLLSREPRLLGDALVSTEPSSLALVRTAERGFLWLRVHFAGRSMHSAYPSDQPGAIVRTSEFVGQVNDAVSRINAKLGSRSSRPSHEHDRLDDVLGVGAAQIVQRVSFNVGTIHGGQAVNLQPDACDVTLDFRVPEQTDIDDLLALVEAEAIKRGGTVDLLGRGTANATTKDQPIVRAVLEAVTSRTGKTPTLSTGLGCTDARLWRQNGIPAVIIGPSPTTMGTDNEYVDVAELLALVDILINSAEAFLAEPDQP